MAGPTGSGDGGSMTGSAGISGPGVGMMGPDGSEGYCGTSSVMGISKAYPHPRPGSPRSRMDPVAATPTEPQDYVAVTAGYAVLAGAVAVLAARNRDDPAPVEPSELVLYGVATAGLARLLSKEKVTEWIRAPFVEEPADGERHPRGRGARYVVGELLTCTRCLGSWSALALVGIRAVAPRQARVGATLLALSYANTLLQARLAGEQAQARHEEALAVDAAGE